MTLHVGVAYKLIRHCCTDQFPVFLRHVLNRHLAISEVDLKTFCRAHGIRRLSLFGSTLKGTAGPDSDVDLLVQFYPDRIPGLLGLAEMITQDYWKRFGRNGYSRHDYEAIDSDAANGLMEMLGEKVKGLAGQSLGGHQVAYADDFAYTDPIDGSVTAHQGIRIGFEDGSRIVYRLSGTGTEVATLRVYLERYEPDPEKHLLEMDEALGDIPALSVEIAEIEARIVRTAPDVIT